MQGFIITPTVDHAGRRYFVVNYPRKGTSGRKQRKFNTLERAQEFLSEIKREWANTGKIRLGGDSHLHCDFLRAVKLLSGVPQASLERAAQVFLQCASMKEKRGKAMAYEVPVDRWIELSPRFFLMGQNEARARNITVAEAVEGLLSEVALGRADQAIRRARNEEKVELEELERRNAAEKKRLRELETEREIARSFQGIDMVFEAGRRSVLEKRNTYARKWYAARKAKWKAEEGEKVNGS
jgi:hypothetical protein